MTARMRLRRADGQVYLDRHGWECRWGGIFLHRMDAPDPGVHLHSHPWYFVSVILKGGYVEERAWTKQAVRWAKGAERLEADVDYGLHVPRGKESTRWPFTIKGFGQNECHRITHLRKKHSWSLVIHGPKRHNWGFYLPTGYVDQDTYRILHPDRVEELTRDG